MIAGSSLGHPSWSDLQEPIHACTRERRMCAMKQSEKGKSEPRAAYLGCLSQADAEARLGRRWCCSPTHDVTQPSLWAFCWQSFQRGTASSAARLLDSNEKNAA